MKDITISKQSKLFKLISFLSTIPFYSLFIKSYNNGSYNTFNDICTFSRHIIYSLIVTLFYVLFSIFIINILIIQPILAIFSTSLLGTITLGYFGLILFIYLVLLICDKIYIEDKVEKLVNSVLKKDSVVSSTVSIISQKHDNFCKRLSVKD